MKLTDIVVPASSVVAREVGNEIVLLDLDSGTYFGLDPVGSRLWQLLTDRTSLAIACDAMLDEYEVTREQIEQDTLNLMRELQSKRLVKVV